MGACRTVSVRQDYEVSYFTVKIRLFWTPQINTIYNHSCWFIWVVNKYESHCLSPNVRGYQLLNRKLGWRTHLSPMTTETGCWVNVWVVLNLKWRMTFLDKISHLSSFGLCHLRRTAQFCHFFSVRAQSILGSFMQAAKKVITLQKWAIWKIVRRQCNTSSSVNSDRCSLVGSFALFLILSHVSLS